MQSGGVYAESQPLVHLCGYADWQQALATGELRSASLLDAGFVHLSDPEQAHLPANRLFTGRTDLVALFLDPGRLGAPVRWEPGLASDPPGMLFPHLYGAVPVPAVIGVRRYLPDAAGRFGPLIHSGGDEMYSGETRDC